MMRLNNSHMSAPFSNQPLSLLIHPHDASANGWGFTAPFEDNLWIFIVASIFAAGLYMVLIEGGKPASPDFEGRAFNSFNSFLNAYSASSFYAFSSLTMMDAWTPVTFAGKMFQMVWTFYCLVTIAAYTAASAAYVAFNAAGEPHLNINSFINTRDPKPACVLAGSAYASFLSKHKTYRYIQQVFCTDLDDMERKLSSGACAGGTR